MLVHARDNDDRLTEGELTWLGAELLLAGHDTTVNTLGRGIFQLLRRRSQWELLTARPHELTEPATEEVFRYAPPSDAGLLRIALEDFELGGVTIRAGEGVIPLMHASSRDERRFADPGRFDITRTPNRHLVFGYGPHHCPAAGVGRMEVQVALGTLARRLPRLALAVEPEAVRWRGGHITLRPETVPVTF
ncbi:cytochrome P450 [Streptomyces sp. HMX112]|uniref:cytochrome P450 n=1 Tax=Streptomyces sp. HMX112 TaxID=3390850 RepID=UPI003A806FD1